MKPNVTAAQLGLPLRKGPIRFAVGPPDGLTSNAWRFWTSKRGDAYIACRDNFKQAKVSLHASGRWRMGFTTEAAAADPLIREGENRAWEVWNEPPPILPETIVAFRLYFPGFELAVRPDQRVPMEDWRKVLYIEGPPPGKLTALTLFVTRGDLVLTHDSEPNFTLASLDIGSGRRAQLVAHTDPEGFVPELIERSVAEAMRSAQAAKVEIPPDGYGYFFGNCSDGARFLVGARLTRQHAK